MTSKLEKAIEKIKTLPEERQIAAADALELIAAQSGEDALTAAEITGIKEAQRAVGRGEIASDQQMQAFLNRFRT